MIERIEESVARSTSKNYQLKWKLFVAWVTELKHNPCKASIPLLTEFLDYMFDSRGSCVTTGKGYKAAILHYWELEVGYSVPRDDNDLKQLFRNLTLQRPLKSRQVPQWDLEIVLKHFKSAQYQEWPVLSDSQLTLKFVFLFSSRVRQEGGENYTRCGTR